jgi:hypothetical protein
LHQGSVSVSFSRRSAAIHLRLRHVDLDYDLRAHGGGSLGLRARPSRSKRRPSPFSNLLLEIPPVTPILPDFGGHSAPPLLFPLPHPIIALCPSPLQPNRPASPLQTIPTRSHSAAMTRPSHDFAYGKRSDSPPPLPPPPQTLTARDSLTRSAPPLLAADGTPQRRLLSAAAAGDLAVLERTILRPSLTSTPSSGRGVRQGRT